MTDPQTETEARRAIVAACRSMTATGLTQGTSGNVSVRAADAILITPSALPYDAMGPDDIVRLRFDGTHDGPRRPSSEWRFHRDILAQRPELGAVVHAHPPATTALAIMEREIPPVHYMVAICGGATIRCAPYALFGTEALSRAALHALKDRTACLLAHHGLIACGATLDQAMWRAEEVEALARQYLACLPMGEPPHLTDAQIDEVLAKLQGYGRTDG